MQIELVPDITHCVETMARKEYQNLARSYLQEGKDDAGFQEKIELLRSFLETADFRKLRRESEAYLVKGERVKFTLYREGNETKCRLTID
jgi:hypothetical protein